VLNDEFVAIYSEATNLSAEDKELINNDLKKYQEDIMEINDISDFTEKYIQIMEILKKPHYNKAILLIQNIFEKTGANISNQTKKEIEKEIEEMTLPTLRQYLNISNSIVKKIDMLNNTASKIMKTSLENKPLITLTISELMKSTDLIFSKQKILYEMKENNKQHDWIVKCLDYLMENPTTYSKYIKKEEISSKLKTITDTENKLKIINKELSIDFTESFEKGKEGLDQFENWLEKTTASINDIATFSGPIAEITKIIEGVNNDAMLNKYKDSLDEFNNSFMNINTVVIGDLRNKLESMYIKYNDETQVIINEVLRYKSIINSYVEKTDKETPSFWNDFNDISSIENYNPITALSLLKESNDWLSAIRDEIITNSSLTKEGLDLFEKLNNQNEVSLSDCSISDLENLSQMFEIRIILL